MSMSMDITDVNTAWAELRKRVEACKKCPLHKSRNRVVFGEGRTQKCRCVIIGEAPGETEDIYGRPFIGAAGQLLTKIFSECGIPREELYITNILKCRPPNNRNPSPTEMDACRGHLEAQLLLLHPDIVVTVGKISTQWMFNNTKQSITNMRGRWFSLRGIKIFPLFHPSYLLRCRNVEHLRLTYGDVHVLRKALDILNSRA